MDSPGLNPPPRFDDVFEGGLRNMDRPDRKKEIGGLIDKYLKWLGDDEELFTQRMLLEKIIALFPDTEELEEELRVGNQLTATLTDKCRALELLIEEAKREVAEDWNKELRITVFKAIKEGKRQERERIFREVELRMYNDSPLMIMPGDWQSLKGEI